MYLPRNNEAVSPLSRWFPLAHVFAALLLCTPIFALNPDRQLSQYAHSAWRLQDGYFNGAPTVIRQTIDGYLWIGTESGLLRFDGVRFVPWTPPAGKKLPSNFITSLLGARDGSLWIGTIAGLAHWKNGGLTDYPETQGFVGAIIEDHKGSVWMVRSRVRNGDGSLCQVTETKARCYGKADGISMPHAGTLLEDPQGDLWIAGPTALERWRLGHSDLYSPPGLEAGSGLSGITSLAMTTDGSLWVGMERAGQGLGLQKFSNGKWKAFVTPELDSSTLTITTLISTGDNVLLVGTAGRGLYRIRGDKVDRFQATDGLTSNSLEDLFEDHEGNLWVATSQGIDCFSNRTVTSFSARQGLESDHVMSVVASQDGDIWIGEGFGLDLFSKGKITSVREAEGFPGERVTSLLEERPGVLWVGIDNGLWIYEKRRFSPVKRAHAAPLGPILTMVQDVDGSIWVEPVGSPARLIHIRNRTIQEEVVLSPKRIGASLLPDPHGGVWIGFRDGKLVHYQSGKLEVIPLTGSPNSVSSNHLISESHGWLLGTTTEGLIGVRNGAAQKLTASNGLPCGVLYNLVLDNNGALWLYAECGLIQIASEEMQKWWDHPETQVKLRLFDLFDGAQPGASPFSPSVAKSPDGRLWFANYSVLQMVDPAQLGRNTIPPPVHIEEVAAERKSYVPQHGLRLPPRLRDLEIDYTALSFVNPKKVLFRYKLEGHDAEWQEPGTRRQAFYTDLPPRRYKFRVIACNNDGTWNEVGDALDFSITPTFYQTVWFRILCTALAAGILWLLYFVRLNQATAQIQQRLGARMEERERIARDLHDTLLQGFQGLMLRLQAVTKTLPAQEPAREKIEKVLDRADQVLLEGRQSVRNLREEGSASDELSETLAHCGEELAQDHPAIFSLSVVGTPQAIGPIVFDESYRIAREALINAFQHSRATKIEAEITYLDSGVCLRIRDDGAGMDAAILRKGRTGHWGLSGMRERAQKIGAQINLWSRTGAGTEVELIIPANLAYRARSKQTLWRRIKRAVSRNENHTL